MEIVAKFSNGHTDTYKGTRAVKAAWMICDKATGEVVASGHSKDRSAAAKTARGNVLDGYHFSRDGDGSKIEFPRTFFAGYKYAYLLKELRAAGFDGADYMGSDARSFAKAHNEKINAAYEARATIEIIDL